MEDERIQEVSDGGISRRKALKRAGIAAALVWSAPVLSSVTTPASAASPIPASCDTCDLDRPCNLRLPCGPDGGCNCWVLADRSRCFCGPFVPCDTLQACGPDRGCPSGFVCVENCCGLLCYPNCGEIPNTGAAPDASGMGVL